VGWQRRLIMALHKRCIARHSRDRNTKNAARCFRLPSISTPQGGIMSAVPISYPLALPALAGAVPPISPLLLNFSRERTDSTDADVLSGFGCCLERGDGH
jgi:hypothetical protein